jgi:hypothetical protein
VTPPAVDAYVETSRDGILWERSFDPGSPNFVKGPWSIPHAVEIGRKWSYIHEKLGFRGGILGTVHTRVVDTAGVVVEQWPKAT